MYYSNKRKEYEAREEKKAAFKNFTQSNRSDNSNDSAPKSFSCPVCLQSGFSGIALKEHFELELRRFKQKEAFKLNKLNNNIDVESVSGIGKL